MSVKILAALAALSFAASAFAQEPPMPRMFQGMTGQKGQWQMEFLEGGPAAKGKMGAMTICTDNLMRQQGGGAAAKAKPESNCKHRVIRDTANEAVVESVCPERTSTVTMKRESAKSVLMDVQSTGPRGPQHMKMRYTHLGPCAEGQAAIGFDKNSEQCQKMRERAAKMDPAKSCARSKEEPGVCEKRMKDMAAQMMAMCK